MRKTKKALTFSSLALLLCVSLLIGVTFAWFTDTAVTGVNTIQAGTLKIDIQDSQGNSLEGKTMSFVGSDGATLSSPLWEPGCRYLLQAAKLVNQGNLALKFKVEITDLVGDAELADVIEVVISGAPVGTLADLMADPDGAAYGDLTPGQEANLGQIELHMLESAGNQYQGKAISGLAICVSATQYTSEYDSYNNTYDAAAEYAPVRADVYVESANELEAALLAANYGDVIAAKSGTYTLSHNIATSGTLIVESNEAVTLNLDGHTISANVSKNDNAPTVQNYGNLTVEGGAIANKNGTAGKTNVAAVHNMSGVLTLNNCTIENVAPTSGGNYCVTVEGGQVVMNDCTVKGNRGGIAVSGSGSVVMNGGSVTATVYYPLYTRGTGASSFNGVSFLKENNSKGKAITFNAFEGGTATFTNCAFETKLGTAPKLDIGNNCVGFSFSGCTYTNVQEP